jgi:hypothetical protein
VAGFTPSGSGGAPLDVTVSEGGIVSYSVVNLTLTDANTEDSIAVPDNAVWISVYNRTDGLTKLAFTTLESATSYITIPPGDSRSYNKKSGVALSLFVQCPKAAQVLEITYGLS